MAYRRRTRSSRGGSRRKLVWAQADTTATFIASGSKWNLDLLANYKAQLGAAMAGATVMRTLLDIWITSTVAGGDALHAGLLVDDLTQVTAAPSTSMMVTDPFNNPYAKWMMNEKLCAAGSYNPWANNNMRHWDIRSKRKLDEVGETLIFSLYEQTAGTQVTFRLFSRSLLALA